MNVIRETNQLDAAIDQVAAGMVHPQDDPDLVIRIVRGLPERSSRFGWLIPRFVAIGTIVMAVIVWTTRSDRVPAIATLPSSDVPAMNTLAPAVAAHAPRAATAVPLDRVPRSAPMEPPVPVMVGDHERALPGIEALRALIVPSLAPVDIAPSELLTVPSIAIDALPMTAASFFEPK